MNDGNNQSPGLAENWPTGFGKLCYRPPSGAHVIEETRPNKSSGGVIICSLGA